MINNLAAHVYDNDNLNHGFRVNNAVKYSYGNNGVWKVSGLYGASNDAGAVSNNRVASAGMSVNFAAFQFAAAYLRLDNDATSNADGAVTLSDRSFIAYSVVDFLAPIHKPMINNLAAHVYDNDNLNHGFRVNNAVKYSYGNNGVWKVSGLYGASNDAGAVSNNRVASAGMSVNFAAFQFAAAYLRLDNDATSNADGAVTLSDRSFIASRQSIYGAGVKWRSGHTTLDALWTHSQFDNLKTINGIGSLGIAVGNANASFDNAELNAHYQFTPALSTTLAVTYTTSRFVQKAAIHHPSWLEPSILVDYRLSKRTDVYTELLYQHARSDGSGLGASINRQPLASGNTQTVVAVGVRQLF